MASVPTQPQQHISESTAPVITLAPPSNGVCGLPSQPPGSVTLRLPSRLVLRGPAIVLIAPRSLRPMQVTDLAASRKAEGWGFVPRCAIWLAERIKARQQVVWLAKPLCRAFQATPNMHISHEWGVDQ